MLLKLLFYVLKNYVSPNKKVPKIDLSIHCLFLSSTIFLISLSNASYRVYLLLKETFSDIFVFYIFSEKKLQKTKLYKSLFLNIKPEED